MSGSSTVFVIPEMDCASEVSTIQAKLENIVGIDNLSFEISQRKLTVKFDEQKISQNEIARILEETGLKISQGDAVDDNAAIYNAGRSYIFRLVLSGIFALSAEFLDLFWKDGPKGLEIALAVAAILLAGLDVYKKGLKAILNGRLDISALMAIAVTGAAIINQWPEAAMVMFLFSVAEWIEAKAFDRARNAFKALLSLAPNETTVLENQTWKKVATESVEVGAIVRVRPGERISLDGTVSKGETSINQAPITGESVPVNKKIGDPVFAGTINEEAEIEFKTTQTAKNTTLAKIVQIVDAAQGARAPTQRFIDQFSKIYTPSIFIIAVLVTIVPPLVLDWGWYESFYKGLVLLVIACPCALVISTPVTIVSGLSGAAKRGILVKGGAYIEKAAELKTIAFDKTGTITYGKPVQKDYEIIETLFEKKARAIALSLAERSDHPVSKAIAEAGKSEGISVLDVRDFTAIKGKGSKGFVDGTQYYLANHALIEELGICSASLEEKLEGYESEGKTVTILSTDKAVIAVFAVVDAPRSDSNEAIAMLHKLGVSTLMLSGDNQKTAEKIAKSVGIREVRGNLLPEDKMEVIKSYSDRQIAIGMVGDGINDAPALASASIGFSMGAAGTDVAIETSDVSIMDDDLRKLPKFILLARNTKRVLKQNISIAIGIKLIFLILTLLGFSTMWMAIFADMGASLIVVFNGLRVSKS